VQETWPEIRPRNKDALLKLVSDAWDEVASSQHYVQRRIESMPRRMRSVVEAQGFWTPYLRCLDLKTALLRVNIQSHISLLVKILQLVYYSRAREQFR
jgi:hypothetical protein